MMDIYAVPPGHIQMTGWNVIKIEQLGTFHIAGYEISAQMWRISSELLEVDLMNLTAKTLSGSQYSFTEPQGEMHSSVVKVLNTDVQEYSIATEDELLQLKPQKTN